MGMSTADILELYGAEQERLMEVLGKVQHILIMCGRGEMDKKMGKAAAKDLMKKAEEIEYVCDNALIEIMIRTKGEDESLVDVCDAIVEHMIKTEAQLDILERRMVDNCEDEWELAEISLIIEKARIWAE